MKRWGEALATLGLYLIPFGVGLGVGLTWNQLRTEHVFNQSTAAVKGWTRATHEEAECLDLNEHLLTILARGCR